ncbi:ChaN family lipoprotein [Hydrotalea sp.]|uniref:ChaN family lipoprotein n=2 Tax=Hydrotalea sp. TaxID=2881279 RepID=UPI00260E8A16|nr:ChaN family lipoprotein [Hydrotalea sp.]
MLYKKSGFIFLLLFAFVTLFAQNNMQNNYFIFDVTQNKTLTFSELVSALSTTQVVFFGEDHNDAVAHYLEDTLLKALVRTKKNVALSLEMFETDCQAPLNEYVAGFITEKQFLANSRPWNNYNDYKPMVETAKQYQLPVIAANAPRRYVSLVHQSGVETLMKLDKLSKTYLPPLPFSAAPAAYQQKFENIMGGHAQFNQNMFDAQNLWDATMSNSIYRFWKHNKSYTIFQVNGRFHSDDKLGTFARLHTLSPKIKMKNISCFSDAQFTHHHWDEWKQQADFIIITNPDVPKTF